MVLFVSVYLIMATAIFRFSYEKGRDGSLFSLDVKPSPNTSAQSNSNGK